MPPHRSTVLPDMVTKPASMEMTMSETIRPYSTAVAAWRHDPSREKNLSMGIGSGITSMLAVSRIAINKLTVIS